MAFIRSSVVVFSTLVAIAILIPVAQAQLGPLFGLFRIQGTLFCTPNGGAIGVNGTPTPVFPNALVQLQCGGTVVSTATTNGSGLFSILMDPLNVLLSTLISRCKLVVNTPLASCNATLPSFGGLVSNLLFIGNTFAGFLNVGNLIPMDFQFNANLNN